MATQFREENCARQCRRGHLYQSDNPEPRCPICESIWQEADSCEQGDDFPRIVATLLALCGAVLVCGWALVVLWMASDMTRKSDRDATTEGGNAGE